MNHEIGTPEGVGSQSATPSAEETAPDPPEQPLGTISDSGEFIPNGVVPIPAPSDQGISKRFPTSDYTNDQN